MKSLKRSVMALVLSFGAASMMPAQAWDENDSVRGSTLRDWSAQWWQWALSVKVDPLLPFGLPLPLDEAKKTNVNPVVDGTGENCMVGQRGDVWFLAGTTGGPGLRTCKLPEGKILFFPIVNASFFNSPGTCGQDKAVNYSVRELRQAVADFANKARELKATLQGNGPKPIRLQPIRLRSGVFEFTQPADNLNLYFSGPPETRECAAGVYSPMVADGWYSVTPPLPAGDYVLKFSGKVPEYGDFTVDVTYNLKVVRTAGK